jgi:hypothetical protein
MQKKFDKVTFSGYVVGYKFYPHKFYLGLKPDVFAICIEKYRFLVFINCDKTNRRKENWSE